MGLPAKSTLKERIFNMLKKIAKYCITFVTTPDAEALERSIDYLLSLIKSEIDPTRS